MIRYLERQCTNTSQDAPQSTKVRLVSSGIPCFFWAGTTFREAETYNHQVGYNLRKGGMVYAIYR